MRTAVALPAVPFKLHLRLVQVSSGSSLSSGKSAAVLLVQAAAAAAASAASVGTPINRRPRCRMLPAPLTGQHAAKHLGRPLHVVPPLVAPQAALRDRGRTPLQPRQATPGLAPQSLGTHPDVYLGLAGQRIIHCFAASSRNIRIVSVLYPCFILIHVQIT